MPRHGRRIAGRAGVGIGPGDEMQILMRKKNSPTKMKYLHPK
jgi:hypothetical protein